MVALLICPSQIASVGAESGTSQESGGISKRSGHNSDSDGDDAQSGGQVSPGDTNAGNQRVLRGAHSVQFHVHNQSLGKAELANSKCWSAEAGQRDCIGKGEAPEIMPLTGVLERIKMRAAAAAQRLARLIFRPVTPCACTSWLAQRLHKVLSLVLQGSDDNTCDSPVPATQELRSKGPPSPQRR